MNRAISWHAIWLVATLALTLYAIGRAAASDQEPWLEYKHLSETPRPGYEPVRTKTDETLYAAQAALLDPIGFADVVPTKDANGIIITLTTGARKRLLQFTEGHVGEMLGIFLDGGIIQGPVRIAKPLSLQKIGLTDELSSAQRTRIVEAWAAPIDTSLGKRKFRVAGLGIIKAKISPGSPGDVTFLHEGSLYGLPVAFLSRPELPEPDREVIRVTVTHGAIRCDGSDLGTSTEALDYIKRTAKQDRLVLVECSKPELDEIPEDEIAKLEPIFLYLYSDAPFVGLRQEMPKGWQWPDHE